MPRHRYTDAVNKCRGEAIVVKQAIMGSAHAQLQRRGVMLTDIDGKHVAR